MQSFSHHAATVRVRRLKDGIAEVVYSGPMGFDSFENLRGMVLGATAEASCLVLRMDRVLCIMGGAPPSPIGSAYRHNRVSAAVIVREDQFDKWDQYARQLAGQGVMRAVFLDSCAERAYQWARLTACGADLAALQ